MQREKVILIAANPSQLQAALQFLALDRIALLAILMEDSSRNLAIGEMQLPVYPFSVLGGRLQTSEDTWWLICGWKQRICVPRQYEIALALSEDEICQREAVKKLMNHRMQAWVDSIMEASVDRNNESVKAAFPQQYFSVQDLIGAEQEAEEYHRKKFQQETIERNLQILEQYVGLCKAYETDPVVVIWPLSPNLRTAYPREMLVFFRVFLHQVQKRIPFRIVDMFDLPLGYDCFYNMGHLNKKGAALASKELVERLTRP